MNLTIYDLIHDYLSAAQSNVQQMKQHFKVDNILLARREGRIPAQGSIPLKYSFHGIGCEFTTSRYTVDVDFNKDGECGGFDTWRLWIFAESQPGHYGALEDQDLIAKELYALEKAGVIAKSGERPSSELYQLKS